jgi:DNA (cytosine-5)-methyltransferase 1
MLGTVCLHKEQGRPVGVYGSLKDDIPKGGKTANTIEEALEAMGISNMIWSELVEAIPPAYTYWLGKQLMGQL